MEKAHTPQAYRPFQKRTNTHTHTNKSDYLINTSLVLPVSILFFFPPSFPLFCPLLHSSSLITPSLHTILLPFLVCCLLLQVFILHSFPTLSDLSQGETLGASIKTTLPTFLCIQPGRPQPAPSVETIQN